MNDSFRYIRPGDRVRFNRYNGIGLRGTEYKAASGKAVLVFPDRVVVSMGGRHGTPAVVDDRNFLKATPERRA